MKKQMILVCAILFSIVASGQNASKRAQHFNTEKKLAIQGYDPVAYFRQGRAIKGKPSLASVHEGVVYHFSSQDNKDVFLKTPAAYEPQYGGWCAYAMGENAEKVEINPETFKIVDGKLYLFYNAFFNNTLKSWNKNEAALKKKADANWKKITQQ